MPKIKRSKKIGKKKKYSWKKCLLEERLSYESFEVTAENASTFSTPEVSEPAHELHSTLQAAVTPEVPKLVPELHSTLQAVCIDQLYMLFLRHMQDSDLRFHDWHILKVNRGILFQLSSNPINVKVKQSVFTTNKDEDTLVEDPLVSNYIPASPPSPGQPRSLETLRRKPTKRLPLSSEDLSSSKLRVQQPKPVCRLCMKTSNVSMVLIYNDVKKKESLVDQIQAVTGLVMVDGDGMPRFICHPCLKRVYEWYAFKQLCYTSDTKFRALAAAMQKAPPGQLFTLDSRAAAKQNKTKRKYTKSTPLVAKPPENIPDLESVTIKEELIEYPDEQIESEFYDSYEVPLNINDVTVKLESEEFIEYTTAVALTNVDQENEHYSEITTQIDVTETVGFSSGDPLASEMPVKAHSIPESQPSFEPSSSHIRFSLISNPSLSLPSPMSDTPLSLPLPISDTPLFLPQPMSDPLLLLPQQIADPPLNLPLPMTDQSLPEPSITLVFDDISSNSKTSTPSATILQPFDQSVPFKILQVPSTSKSIVGHLPISSTFQELDPKRQAIDETDNPHKKKKNVHDLHEKL